MSGEISPKHNPVHRFPISIKGVVFRGSQVILLKNERNEWELPGGKIELGETPEACVRREIEEELGLQVRVIQILDSWIYHIREGADVFIVTYGCLSEPGGEIVPSSEHKATGLFELEEVPALTMPEGYKRSIQDWARRREINSR
jgi:8-oxo-dGTP pyrophosphatase MutT (NUDIX family)